MSRRICQRSIHDPHIGPYIVATLAVALLVGTAVTSWADPKSQGTRLRLEVAGYRAYESDKANGDYYLQGSAELEFPVVKHATLGLRVLPLFLYPEGADDATVYGLAAGGTARLYQHGDDYSGLFAEVGAAALWRMKEFKLDDSKVDLLSDCGIGYKFRNSGWHLAVKGEHVSEGISGVGLAAGYSF